MLEITSLLYTFKVQYIQYEYISFILLTYTDFYVFVSKYYSKIKEQNKIV